MTAYVFNPSAGKKLTNTQQIKVNTMLLILAIGVCKQGSCAFNALKPPVEYECKLAPHAYPRQLFAINYANVVSAFN